MTPIEHLRPGDLVIGHDGSPHSVRRVIETPHHGWSVCLRTDAAESPLWLTIDHRILSRLRPRTLGGHRDWTGSPEWHEERRRELRRDGTVAERKLWSVLRGKSTGFKFRRQHSLGIQNQCRLRTETVADASWVQAGSLLPGDIVFTIEPPVGAASGDETTPRPPPQSPRERGEE